MATRASYKRYVGLLGGALVLALVVGILAPAAQASPFLGVYMKVRVGGATPGEWVTGTYDTVTKTWTKPVLAVNTGDTIEYKLYTLWTGEVGMHNDIGTTATGNDIYITSLTAGTNGINSMKFNVYQTSADLLQVNFGTASAVDGTIWNPAGSGYSGGTPTQRTGAAAGVMNLVGVRPIAASGVYLGLVGATPTPTPVLISTGSATVGGTFSKTVDSTILMGHVLPTSQTIPSTTRVNSPAVSISEYATWTGTPTFDPVTVYAGVTLYTPWAEAVIKDIPVGGFVVDLELNPLATLTLNANVGGSSHTVVTYHWTVNTAGPLEIDTSTPMLTLTNEQLNTLLGQGQDHTIMLSVTTADGKNASLGAPVPLTLLPEPATMVLLSLGGLVTLLRRRRIR